MTTALKVISDRSRSLQRLTGTALAAAYAALAISVVASIALFSALIERPWIPPALAAAVFVVGLFPAARIFIRKDTSRVPFMPLVGLYYAVAFGLSYFLPGNADYSDPAWTTEAQTRAFATALSGVALMFSSYAIGQLWVFRRFPIVTVPRRRLGLISLHTLAWIALLANTLFYFWKPLQSIPTFPLLIGGTSGYLGFAVAFFLWLQGKLGRSERVLLGGVVIPANLVLRLATGLLGEVMIIGLIFAVVMWRERGQIPWTLTMVGFAFFVALSPVKFEYRELLQTLPNAPADTSATEQIALGLDLATHYLNSGSEFRASDFTYTAGGRLNDALTLARVMDLTPSSVPYWAGRTYTPLLTHWIPRILWSGKPVENTGNEFGHRYGYLGPDDDQTSYNLPWLVEMYANFGFLGVLVGMLIAGLVLSLIDRLLNPSTREPASMALAVCVLLGMTIQESGFSGMIGGLPQTVIVLMLALWFTRRANSSVAAK